MHPTIYLSNVPTACSRDELAQACSQFGPVTKAHIVVDPVTGIGSGEAEVGFETQDAANQALAAGNLTCRGVLVNLKSAPAS